jgi:hypothetical protein
MISRRQKKVLRFNFFVSGRDIVAFSDGVENQKQSTIQHPLPGGIGGVGHVGCSQASPCKIAVFRVELFDDGIDVLDERVTNNSHSCVGLLDYLHLKPIQNLSLLCMMLCAKNASKLIY